MLYIYPDNFIVPVVFVENFMEKKTSEKLNEDKLSNDIEEIKKTINNEEQEKFRHDGKKECYDELQEEFIMDWKHEGEYSLHIDYKKILDSIDEEYACSETSKI